MLCMLRALLLVAGYCTVQATPPPTDLGDVVFIILSQPCPPHSERAQVKQHEWASTVSTSTRYRSLSKSYQMERVWLARLHTGKDAVVLLSHEIQGVDAGAWTILPLIPVLSERYQDASWFFFANEETQVDFAMLRKVLARYNPQEEHFLGHALWDEARTITHHYITERTISYPNFPSGWAISSPVLHKMANHFDQFNPNFNIDPQFELAVFLKYLSTPELTHFIPDPPPTSQEGVLLTNVPEFCTSATLGGPCTTAYSQHIPDCGRVDLSDVFFAVKTCEKFHNSRLSVVQQIWGKDARGSIGYFSETEDKEYSTTNIGVPNTERGHCGKTMAIVDRFYSDASLSGRRWLIIADDDTILSVSRVCRLLACYNASLPILLGEVYGYKDHQHYGTRYVTGGGSMVLSREAVRRMTGHGCPALDYPDDLFLGSTARQLGVHIVHSPLFHQSQPESYPPSVLGLQTAISFHRHSPQDPSTVYQQYLTDSLPSWKTKTEL